MSASRPRSNEKWIWARVESVDVVIDTNVKRVIDRVRESKNMLSEFAKSKRRKIVSLSLNENKICAIFVNKIPTRARLKFRVYRPERGTRIRVCFVTTKAKKVE